MDVPRPYESLEEEKQYENLIVDLLRHNDRIVKQVFDGIPPTRMEVDDMLQDFQYGRSCPTRGATFWGLLGRHGPLNYLRRHGLPINPTLRSLYHALCKDFKVKPQDGVLRFSPNCSGGFQGMSSRQFESSANLYRVAEAVAKSSPRTPAKSSPKKRRVQGPP